MSEEPRMWHRLSDGQVMDGMMQITPATVTLITQRIERGRVHAENCRTEADELRAQAAGVEAEAEAAAAMAEDMEMLLANCRVVGDDVTGDGDA